MPLSALGFLALFVGAVIAGLLRWPMLTLGAYMMSFYGHPPSRWWGAFLPDLRWALVSAAAAFAAAWMYRSRNTEQNAWTADPIILLVMCYIAWMWIQTPWAVDQATHIEGTVIMTKYLLIIFVLIKLLDNPRHVELFIFMHMAGCAYFGLLARVYGSGGTRLDGVGGPGVDDANTLGMMFATALVLGGVQLLRGPWWSRIFCAISLPIILNGLILTQSRGAFLGLAVGGVVMLLLAPKGDRRKLYGLAALGLVALSALAHEQFWERIQTIGAEKHERDFSAETRVVLAQAQLRMFADYPHGAGHRGTAALSRQYLSQEYMANEAGVPEHQRARSSHNTVLSVLVEQGVVGIVIYGVLALVTLRRIMRVRRGPRNEEESRIALLGASVAGGLAVVFCAGQFADYLRAEVQMWLLAMLVALTRILARMRAEEAASEAVTPASPVRDAAPAGGQTAREVHR